MDDGLLRIAGLELFRQGAKTKLTTDLGGLETVLAVGELESVDFLLVLHALDRDAASVEFVEEHRVTRQTFPAVLLEQGVADAPNLLLCPLSFRIGLGFPVRSHGSDFFCDGQPILVAEFFGHSRRSIAHESGVVDLSAEADSIGDDVHVVDVFCGAYSMVGGDENGCDYGPLPRAPKGGGASAVCGNKLTSCITVVTLRYIPSVFLTISACHAFMPHKTLSITGKTERAEKQRTEKKGRQTFSTFCLDFSWIREDGIGGLQRAGWIETSQRAKNARKGA